MSYSTTLTPPLGSDPQFPMDGVPAGETEGSQVFVAPLVPGEHVLSCSTADGATAGTSFTVEPAENLH